MAVFDKLNGAMWIGVSQIVLLAVNFLLLRLMTSHLTVESYGYYSLCMSIVLFARQVLYDPSSIVIARTCSSVTSDLRKVSDGFQVVRFLTDALGLGLILLGLLTLGVANAVITNPLESVVVISCIVYLLANGAQGIYFNVLNSIKLRKPAALFLVLDSVLKLLLVFISLWIFGGELSGALAAVATGALAVFILARWYISTTISSGPLSVARVKGMACRSFMLSLPLYLPSLLSAFKSVWDRWVLAIYIGVEELAAFSVLLQLGYFPVLLVVGVMQTFLAPKIYGLSAVEDSSGFLELKQFLNKLLFGIVVFGCLTSGIGVVFADWVFQVLVGKDFRLFANYLPFLIVSGALAAVASILHIVVIGLFKTYIVGRLMTVSVLLSIAVALPLIVFLGLRGAIAGLMISGIVTAVIYWVAIRFCAFGSVKPGWLLYGASK